MFELENFKSAIDQSIEDKHRSKMKRFVSLLPIIENAVTEGMEHKDIWEILVSQEFDCTFKTYKTMLRRARERDSRDKGKQLEKPVLQVRSAVSDSTTSPSSVVSKVRDGIPDPRTLSWVPGGKAEW